MSWAPLIIFFSDEFPWQISLQKIVTLGTKEFRGKHVCGGSIIGKNKILTAGHCLKNGSKYMVRIKVIIVLLIPFSFLVFWSLLGTKLQKCVFQFFVIAASELKCCSISLLWIFKKHFYRLQQVHMKNIVLIVSINKGVWCRLKFMKITIKSGSSDTTLAC